MACRNTHKKMGSSSDSVQRPAYRQQPSPKRHRLAVLIRFPSLYFCFSSGGECQCAIHQSGSSRDVGWPLDAWHKERGHLLESFSATCCVLLSLSYFLRSDPSGQSPCLAPPFCVWLPFRTRHPVLPPCNSAARANPSLRCTPLSDMTSLGSK